MQLTKLFFRALRKLGILKYLNVTTSIYLSGNQYKIPILAGIGLENLLDMSEPWMTSLFQKLLRKVDRAVFLDVGVNIGQTLLKVKSIRNDMVYVGFEPNPACVEYCKQLVKANNFTNTEIFPVALGDVTDVKRLQFYVDSATDGSASLVPDFRQSSTPVVSVNVPVFCFHDISALQQIESQIAIIKIDVEGAELGVLLGFIEVLRLQRPLVIVEILPVYSATNYERLSRQQKIQDVVAEVNYAIARIKKAGPELGGLTFIKEFGIHSQLSQSDYLLCPVERCDEIMEVLAQENSSYTKL